MWGYVSLIVQKYGGTSVGTLDRILNVAKRIKFTVENGNNVVVVVSAMAGVTNELASLAERLNCTEGDREYDALVSSGELVSASLLAAALNNIGASARSYSAWQIPILTDNLYGRANIECIFSENLLDSLSSGMIPIVCGFQGINKQDNSTTTIGRGGSDLSAVLLASYINADLCEIYSDVDGVYSADPNRIQTAKLIPYLNYDFMLEMAMNGAKILQAKSVRAAMEHNVKIRVASSFIESRGSVICNSLHHEDAELFSVSLINDLIEIAFHEDKLDIVNREMHENYIKIFDTKIRNRNCYLLISSNDLAHFIRVLNKIGLKEKEYKIQSTNNSSVCAVFSSDIMKKCFLEKIYSMKNLKYLRMNESSNNSIIILLNKQNAYSFESSIHDMFIDSSFVI